MNLGHEKQILKQYIYFFSLQRASSSKKVKLGRIPSARGAVRLSEAYVHLKILFAWQYSAEVFIAIIMCDLNIFI